MTSVIETEFMKIFFPKAALLASMMLAMFFLCSYFYVLIIHPNPQVTPDLDWRSVVIGHGKIKMAHSLQPSSQSNNLAMTTHPYDLENNFHIIITKNWGGQLVFLNQNMPSEGMMVAGMNGDQIKVTGWSLLGLHYKNITHSINANENWWTFMISIWYPVVFFGVLSCLFYTNIHRAKLRVKLNGLATQ